MVHNSSQIPLSEEFKAGFLWQNHAQHGVRLFNTVADLMSKEISYWSG